MKIFRNAFTLVELMVVIIILSILWAISMIWLQSYSSDARDSKRKSDINNIYTKINVELSTWKTLDQLIVVTNTWNIVINNKSSITNQWLTDFSVLKENILDFQDNWINYPISYSIWNTWTWKYNFVQIATISESTNQAIVIWNYYKIHNLDSQWIIINSQNKIVVDWWDILPY